MAYIQKYLRRKRSRAHSLPVHRRPQRVLPPPPGHRFRLHTLGKRPVGYRFAPSLEDERSNASKNSKTTHSIDDTQVSQEGAAASSQSQEGETASKEPWHQNDQFVRKLDYAEMRLYTEPTSRSPDPQPFGNDTCPIHPIFQSLANLAGGDGGIPLFGPVLRLATRFLLSPHTLPFFHTLLTSSPVFFPAESAYYQAWVTNLEPSPYQATGLLPLEKLKTLQMLVALQHHIQIRISPEPRLSDKWAYTERYIPPRYPTQHAHLPSLYPMPLDFHATIPATHPSPHTQHLLNPAHPFTGTNAVINLSSNFLTLLHPSTLATRTQAQLLRGMFFVALTLLHELAHTVWQTRFPPPPPSTTTDPTPPEYEPFYSHQRTSELGHALETTWFSGGKILSLASDPFFGIGLGWQRWPTASDFNVLNYRREIVPLARLSGVDTCAGDLGRVKPRGGPKWETIYMLSHSWIKRFFYVEFWEAFERAGGFAGLDWMEGQKELGVRRENWGFGLEVRVDSTWGMGDGLETGCSSEGRWPDSAGVVRPGEVKSEVRDDMLEFGAEDDEDDEMEDEG